MMTCLKLVEQVQVSAPCGMVEVTTVIAAKVGASEALACEALHFYILYLVLMH
jgi:hypothetical protein